MKNNKKNSLYCTISAGRRVAHARKTLGMTQEKAAEKLDVSAVHYRGIEYGSREMSLKLMVRISQLYNVSIDYIVFGNRALPERFFNAIELISKLYELIQPFRAP